MLRILAINSNKIVLSFSVLIAFWSPKQSEIEESSLESCKRCPDRASRQHIRIGYAIVRVWWSRVLRGLWQAVFFIRTTYPDRICYHPDISTPPTFHSNVSHPDRGLRRHSTRMSYIRKSAPPPFHPDVLHPTHSIRRRFNFSGRTYPDHLIASTRRVSQIFCTVPRCSPEAFWHVPPTFWDILGYFALDVLCLNPQTLLVTHQL